MPAIETVLARMRGYGATPALWSRNGETSYDELFARVDTWRRLLPAHGIAEGSVCGFVADYSVESTAFALALLEARAILVPFSPAVQPEIPAFLRIAAVERLVRFGAGADAPAWTFDPPLSFPPTALVTTFRERRSPGLVVFSSGSTGAPKAILHDCERVLQKFLAERPAWRTVLFLLPDHFGGFNTWLATLANGGTGLCVEPRSPEVVCRAIAEGRATLLPTTPTFLNLLLASGVHRSFDLSSLRLITYGTEVMAPATLARVRATFPNAEIKQTYGLSELGVLRSRSESDDSVWVRVGGDGFEVKVVDGLLWVRAVSNMVGYLNAPSPFDEEGWMCTGDAVEVKGDYLRFLGRTSDLINVGGQKVYPVEVETVLLQAPGITDATVYGSAHPLLGQVVHARVSCEPPEPPTELSERLRRFCLDRLARYKVPVRVVVSRDPESASVRFKRQRSPAPVEP